VQQPKRVSFSKRLRPEPVPSSSSGRPVPPHRDSSGANGDTDIHRSITGTFVQVGIDPGPDEAALKKPFERALIRNLRMLNRHLRELRGDLALVSEQIATERADAAKAKEKG
jgi:hypothetical protein